MTTVRKYAHITNRWAVILIALTTGITIVLQIINLAPASAISDNYPWPNAPCATTGSNLGKTSGTGYWCTNYNWGESTCPTGDTYCTSGNKMNGYYLYDQWGEGFRNCVSYTSWMLNQTFNINPSNWGNGADWNNSALAAHYTDDPSPQIGDVAQWDGTQQNQWGHVAYVYNVVGNVAYYAEYNYAADGNFLNSYSSTTQGAPTHYIHIGNPPSPYTGVGSATCSGGNSMASGTTLLPNYYLTSSNVQHALIFQSADKNLVLYNNGAIWQSFTGGSNANRLVMQTDGNLVMYRADNSVAFQTFSGGNPGAYAKLQDDGNFVVYTTTGFPLYASNTGGHANLTYFGSDRMTGGQQITQGQYLRSGDGRYAVLMQTDGDGVLYGPGYHKLWDTVSTGHGDTFKQQTDGNLVLYALGVWQWQSYTGSHPGAWTVIQTDGNFIVYSSTNFPLWTSGTGGKI